MALAVGVLALFAVMLAVMVMRRRPARRLAVLAARAIAGRQHSQQRAVPAELFRLLYQAIRRRDYSLAFQGAESLKTIFATIPATAADQRRTAVLLVAVIRRQWPELGLHVADVYRPLLRTLAAHGADLVPAAGRLAFAGALAMREKQPVLAAKVLDTLFYLYHKAVPEQRTAVTAAVFHALDELTRQAMRARDYGLLQEVAGRIGAVSAEDIVAWRRAREWVTALMYRAVSDGNVRVAAMASSFLRQWAQYRGAETEQLVAVTEEWADIARLALLNPHHRITPLLLEDLFAVSHCRLDWQVGRLAVGKSAAIATWAILRYNPVAARPVLWPLLQEGRHLMQWELRFGCGDPDCYRQRMLEGILSACLRLNQVAVRQDFTLTPGDFIAETCRAWLDTPDGQRTVRSTKKFCRLWLQYWMQERQRQARHYPPRGELAAAATLTPQERQRITFLHA